jgi:transcriptional regulator with XRE-family HTH domain
MTFGKLFKSLRESRKMSLRALAKKLGKPHDGGNISKVEKGIRPPPHSVKNLEKLCAPLKLNDDELNALKLRAFNEHEQKLFDNWKPQSNDKEGG